jgi:tetratricopeptide (TPR) repeat protein
VPVKNCALTPPPDRHSQHEASPLGNGRTTFGRCFSAALLTATIASVGLPRPTVAQQPEACPSASALLAEEGWAAYGSDDMAGARASFEAALARCSDDEYARTGLAYVALRGGETVRARELLESVVVAEPDNVDALVGLGLVAWRSGDLDEVERRFSRVASLAPGHATAQEYLERLQRVEEDSTNPDDPADAAWRAGDTDGALRLYSERLDQNPADGTALLRVGLLRAWSEQYRAALELFDTLLDLEPTNVDARLARARVHAWAGDLPEAEAEVRRVLTAQPENLEALSALAQFQSWSGRGEEALDSYQAVLSIAPEHAAGAQWARTVARVEGHEASIAAFESLVASDPTDVEARVGLATAFAYTGEYDAALAQYEEVLRIAPSDVRAAIGRARVLGWSGRLVAAQSAAVRAVEAAPNVGRTWAMLGQIYRWQGRDADAKQALETAARLAPTDAEIRDQLQAVRLAFAPAAQPTFAAERDSDGNRMLTTSLGASWHPLDRLELRASGYHRRLEQSLATGALERTASGMLVRGTYQTRPGWVLSGGVGGSMSDGPDDPRFLSFEAAVRTPTRFPLGAGLALTSAGLDATAALAQRGVRASELLVTTRWTPGPAWRVDGSVGIGRYEGTERNGRRSAALAASRRFGPSVYLGTSWRGFSFEKNLFDGYFDPDFYGVAELTGQWAYRGRPWSVLVELAPGVQQVGSEGSASASLRTNGRVGYRIGAGREVSLAVGYSTAGLTQFATGESGYDYTAIVVGLNWIF